jgi:uncharacterized phage protein gp47/JayE
MNEQIDEVPVVKPPKPRKQVKKRASAKRETKPNDVPARGGEFAGVSATSCCAACTAERCVISTVDICKHPYKTADSGCGPVTMKNRIAVRKILKHQIIDLTGG